MRCRSVWPRVGRRCIPHNESGRVIRTNAFKKSFRAGEGPLKERKWKRSRGFAEHSYLISLE